MLDLTMPFRYVWYHVRYFWWVLRIPSEDVNYMTWHQRNAYYDRVAEHMSKEPYWHG